MIRALALTVCLSFVPRTGSAALFAAAGKADITPDLDKETVWLAGYGMSGRRPAGVRDPLHARALVLSDGKKTVALVAVDSIGIYREDVRDIRRRLGWADREDRYLLLAATHDHSAPDTVGLWGRFPGVSGVNKVYQERLKSRIVDLVRELDAGKEEVEMSAAVSTLDPSGLCFDSRDPVVLDTELNVLSFVRPGGKAVGTLVRWSCHPEVLGSGNRFVTADYPGALCAQIEKSTEGGCVFFSGMVGGLLSPVVDQSKGIEHQFTVMKELGMKVALAALSSLDGGADRFKDAGISFDARIVRLQVENSRYILFLRSLTFGHLLSDSTGRLLDRWKTYEYPLRHLLFYPLPDALKPWVETEVSLVRIGPIRLLGIPGELFPELALGGYAGEHAYGYPLIRPGNTNPPRLENAPPPPYLREKMGAKHGWIIGLANDEVGYIIPEYDFQFKDNRAMAPRPAGTHYEETNSIGRSATKTILDAAESLLAE